MKEAELLEKLHLVELEVVLRYQAALDGGQIAGSNSDLLAVEATVSPDGSGNGTVWVPVKYPSSIATLPDSCLCSDSKPASGNASTCCLR